MNLRDYVNVGGYDCPFVLFEAIVMQTRRCCPRFGRIFHTKALIPVLPSDSADACLVFGGEGFEQAVFHNIVEVAQNTDVIRYSVIVVNAPDFRVILVQDFKVITVD